VTRANLTGGGPRASASGVLDDPVWSSLHGAHAHLARWVGRAVQYPCDVSPFATLADRSDDAAWADLATLAGPAVQVLLAGDEPVPPPGWTVVRRLDGVQLTGETLAAAEDPRAEVLGTADIPEMLDLVARTQPGPFAARTIELGTYLGIRDGGTLVAMAGERMRPAGWTEISAVCTDPAYRGRGLAGRLIRAAAVGIRARGELPFLHASAENTSAVRLYERIGFTPRRPMVFAILRSPDPGPGPGGSTPDPDDSTHDPDDSTHGPDDSTHGPNGSSPGPHGSAPGAVGTGPGGG
jgi:ribosomal protein S18 acetylase RimI-like enzyme